MAALTARRPRGAKQARPATPTEAVAPRDAGEPIMAIVSIKCQQVTFTTPMLDPARAGLDRHRDANAAGSSPSSSEKGPPLEHV